MELDGRLGHSMSSTLCTYYLHGPVASLAFLIAGIILDESRALKWLAHPTQRYHLRNLIF